MTKEKEALKFWTIPIMVFVFVFVFGFLLFQVVRYEAHFCENKTGIHHLDNPWDGAGPYAINCSDWNSTSEAMDKTDPGID